MITAQEFANRLRAGVYSNLRSAEVCLYTHARRAHWTDQQKKLSLNTTRAYFLRNEELAVTLTAEEKKQALAPLPRDVGRVVESDPLAELFSEGLADLRKSAQYTDLAKQQKRELEELQLTHKAQVFTLLAELADRPQTNLRLVKSK